MSHFMALISDIHAGVRNNSETYIKITEDFFYKTLANVIDTRKIKDCRILGDLFDCRNNINVRTLNSILNIFQWYLDKYSDVKFQILLGNHDIYYRNRIDINSLEMLRKFENVQIVDDIQVEEINNKKIVTVPWLVDDSVIKKNFDTICSSKKKYDLCLGHFEIQGFEMVRGHVDDHGEKQGKFKNFGRVFTGHYHIRNTQKHITYLGCPFQLTWNDYGDQKGIHIYDLENNDTEFIPNKLSPIHIKFKISDILKDKDIKKKVSGNNIKVIIDKKYEETEIIEAMTKVESLTPLKIDTETQYIDDDDDDIEDDIDDVGDPKKFLLDYINKIEIEDKLDKKQLISYADEIFQQTLSDND